MLPCICILTVMPPVYTTLVVYGPPLPLGYSCLPQPIGRWRGIRYCSCGAEGLWVERGEGVRMRATAVRVSNKRGLHIHKGSYCLINFEIRFFLGIHESV